MNIYKSNFTKSITNRLTYNLATLILNEYKFMIDVNGIMYFDDGSPQNYNNIIKDKKFI